MMNKQLAFVKSGLGLALCFLMVGAGVTPPIHASNANVSISQQAKKVTGTVTDAKGEPLLGVNVVVKGTTNGTITDLDGKYSLEVEPNSILVVSYIGYVSQQIPASGEVVNVTLKEDTQNLDEVVVVGYGTQQKKDITGSVAVVDTKDLLASSGSSATQQLQGKAGSPDKSGGKFFNSIENLHLCTMNNQGLLALAQLILPSEILSNFEVVRVEEEASLIRIYLDESVKAEYKENPEIESKGFCEAVTIRDFPIRDKGVDLIVRRRKWYDKQNNRYFSDSYDLKAEETRYSKEFAAFLKGVYGDDSYDLPFA